MRKKCSARIRCLLQCRPGVGMGFESDQLGLRIGEKRRVDRGPRVGRRRRHLRPSASEIGRSGSRRKPALLSAILVSPGEVAFDGCDARVRAGARLRSLSGRHDLGPHRRERVRHLLSRPYAHFPSRVRINTIGGPKQHVARQFKRRRKQVEETESPPGQNCNIICIIQCAYIDVSRSKQERDLRRCKHG